MIPTILSVGLVLCADRPRLAFLVAYQGRRALLIVTPIPGGFELEVCGEVRA